MGVYKMLVLNCQKMLEINCHFLLESTCRLQMCHFGAKIGIFSTSCGATFGLFGTIVTHLLFSAFFDCGATLVLKSAVLAPLVVLHWPFLAPLWHIFYHHRF